MNKEASKIKLEEQFEEGAVNPNNPEERLYICPICGKGVFIDSWEYAYATDALTMVNTLYICDECYMKRHKEEE